MTEPEASIWAPVAEPGDILWCRFPQVQGLRSPGPKPRPSLVLSVWDDERPPRLRVAYGTSRRVMLLHPGEFAITLDDDEAFGYSGLIWPTKFDLRNTVDLPYTSKWFQSAPGVRTPKLGRLHASLIVRAHAVYQVATRPLR